jgi:two-component system NtrC family sensor kinase
MRARLTPLTLRTALLLTLALPAMAAAIVAVLIVLLFHRMADSVYGALFVSLLIVADLSVFVLLAARMVGRVVNDPIRGIVDAVGAIAGGELRRRAPEASETREFGALAASINRMTDHLLAEQEQRGRVERMASVGRLAAGVAHEIGNPLGAINNYAFILRSRVPRDADLAVEALDGLEREVVRIDRIVRGLLDYARQRKLNPTRIDLNDTLQRIVKLLTDQGVLRKLTVRLSLDPRQPVIFGEAHDLEQAFVNLILNAVDAMPKGGEVVLYTERLPRSALQEAVARRSEDSPLKIVPRHSPPRVDDWMERVQPPADVVKVVVADSGPGVPDEDAERVFDPFYSTKEPGKGTGLGLAIVARIVDNMRGTIWVERAREGGAAFHLLFPLQG